MNFWQHMLDWETGMDRGNDMDDVRMDWLLTVTEPGHRLTDDELGQLTADSQARQDYRLLTALQDGVLAGNGPTETADAEWDKFEQRHLMIVGAPRRAWLPKVWLYRTVGIAAAVLLLLGAWLWPRASQGFVAYERLETDTMLTLSRNDGEPVSLTENSHHAAVPSVTSSRGLLVLDYQRLVDEGYSVSREVETHTVEMPCGKDFKLVLADGTEVWLHAGTRMTYPSHFVGPERRVYLDGEAYFKIAKNADMPFIIFTEELQARVLGTELNVSCRDGEPPHVALVDGAVELSRQGVASVTLHPGQGVTLADGGQRFCVAEENMDPYKYWCMGFLYFDESPLAEIVMSLGRWYNVNVVVENTEAMNLHMRFFCRRSDGLLRVTDLLNSFKQFKAEVKANTLYIK